jgi:hypothetical protein
VGLGGFEDLRGVVAEDEAEQFEEAQAIIDEVTEERRGAFAEGLMFG